MVSVFHSSALTESFLHLYLLPLYVPELSSLSLAWHSWFCWWRKTWHYFHFISSSSFKVLPSIFPPSHAPRGLFFNGRAQLPRFLHLVLVRTDLKPCPWEWVAVALIQLPDLPGSTSLQFASARGGQGGGRKRRKKAGSRILGSLCSDPHPSILLWMPQYENNPITVNPWTTS